MHRLKILLACLLLLFGPALTAEPDGLPQEVEELRLRSVNLARDIWLFEQQADGELGRLLVYLSVDPRLEDRPTRIELKLGEDSIALHEYRAEEVDALTKGGAHRLYTDALDAGRHVLDAQLETRRGARRNQHNAKLSFRNSTEVKTVELRLERNASGTAELTVREWD